MQATAVNAGNSGLFLEAWDTMSEHNTDGRLGYGFAKALTRYDRSEVSHKRCDADF